MAEAWGRQRAGRLKSAPSGRKSRSYRTEQTWLDVQLHHSALGKSKNSLNLGVLTCKIEKIPILQVLIRSI